MLRHFFYTRRAMARAGDSPWSPTAADSHPNPKNGSYSPVIDLTDEDRNLPLAVLFWVYPPPDWTRGSIIGHLTTEALRSYMHGVLHGPEADPHLGVRLTAARTALDQSGYKTIMQIPTERERLLFLYRYAYHASPGGYSGVRIFDEIVRGLFPPEPECAAPLPSPDDLIGGAELPEPKPATERTGS